MAIRIRNVGTLARISFETQLDLVDESGPNYSPKRAMSGIPKSEWQGRIEQTSAWQDYVAAMAEEGVEVQYGVSIGDHEHRNAQAAWRAKVAEEKNLLRYQHHTTPNAQPRAPEVQEVRQDSEARFVRVLEERR